MNKKPRTEEPISTLSFEEQEYLLKSAQIVDSLLEGKGLDYIIDVCSIVLGNPFFIRDLQFSICGFTKNVSTTDTVWNATIENGYQSFLDFQYLLSNGFIEHINQFRVPIHYKIKYSEEPNRHPVIKKETFQDMYYMQQIREDNNERCDRVWCQVRVDGTTIGHLVAFAVNREFRDIDIMLTKKIADIIGIELKKRKNYYNYKKNEQAEKLFSDLLDEKKANTAALAEKAKIMNIYFEPFFLVFTLSFLHTDKISLPVNYIQGFFEHVFGKHYCLTYENDVIIILNKTKEIEIKESQYEQLEKFTKDSNITIGISQSFSDFTDFRLYYNQCISAIHSGSKSSPDKKILFYQNYSVDHILYLCSQQTRLMQFCHPAVIKLMDYDRKHATSFCDTLYAYVMNCNAPAELAKDLAIHRNTLYYRLSKIEEIMDLNLNAMENIYQLYLSFQILHYLKVNP